MNVTRWSETEPCTNPCTAQKGKATPEGVYMEPFILYLRPSEKKERKKSDDRWVAWFRDPVNGAKLPKNRINIDTLNERLYGGMRVHITSKSEAYRIAQDALSKGVVFDYVKEQKPRLAAYIEEFWDYDRSPYIKRKRVEGSKITRAYAVNMGRAFVKHCLPYIPVDLPLDGFTVSMMDKIKNALYDAGLSSSTIHKALESVKVALREAYKQELITDNVGERLRAVKIKGKEKGILTAEEAAALIKHLKKTTDKDSYERWRYLFTAVIYYSGIRNSEIMALTPDCIEIIDVKQSRLHVRRGWNEIDGFKTPKNGKERTVTIPTPLAEELLQWSDGNGSELIFYSISDRTKPIYEKHINSNFRDALKAIGITETEQKKRNLSFYSLRHGFNTAMVNSGLGELEIRSVTGHSSVAMTEHYNHETNERLQRQAEAREKAIPFIE